MKDDAATAETLVKIGYSHEEAEDAIRARENYADFIKNDGDLSLRVNSIENVEKEDIRKDIELNQ